MFNKDEHNQKESKNHVQQTPGICVKFTNRYNTQQSYYFTIPSAMPTQIYSKNDSDLSFIFHKINLNAHISSWRQTIRNFPFSDNSSQPLPWSYLSLDVATSEEFVDHQQGTVRPIVTVHSMFSSQCLVELSLHLFKTLL